MSLQSDNRTIALDALQAIQSFEQAHPDEEAKKNLQNAIQQTILKLGSQTLRRCILYLTAQMSKEESKQSAPFTAANAYLWLYQQSAGFLEKEAASFQHYLLREASVSELTMIRARLAQFLACLKQVSA